MPALCSNWLGCEEMRQGLAAAAALGTLKPCCTAMVLPLLPWSHFLRTQSSVVWRWWTSAAAGPLGRETTTLQVCRAVPAALLQACKQGCDV